MPYSCDEIARFCQIVYHHIGIDIEEKDKEYLARLLGARLAALRMDAPQTYFLFLEMAPEENEFEWQLLANRLRVGESYFLRDSGQMNLLEQTLLPELMQRNIHSHSLRILSAGCSTGEEPYSLSILLDRIMPLYESWNIEILGVDIDEHALKVANSGCYTDWSLRRVPLEIKDAYFERKGNCWQIYPKIRANVSFMRLNMAKDLFTQAGIAITKMDLIICRNVFIYFGFETIKRLTDRFVDALNPGGYLMTGHGELRGIKHPSLLVRSFTDSVAYQRIPDDENLSAPVAPSHAEVLTATLPTVNHPHSQKRPSKLLSKKPLLPIRKAVSKVNQPKAEFLKQRPPVDSCIATIIEIQTMLKRGEYEPVIVAGRQLLDKLPQELKAWILVAQAYANIGQYKEAEFCCVNLLEINSFYAPAYFLMSHIALETGNFNKRKELLKKALYLDHTFIAPQLELAEILDQEGDNKRARKIRQTACNILESLPNNAVLDMLEEWTVSELLEQVRSLI